MGVRVVGIVFSDNSVVSVLTETTELFDLGQAFINYRGWDVRGAQSIFMSVAALNRWVFLFIVNSLYTASDPFRCSYTRGCEGY